MSQVAPQCNGLVVDADGKKKFDRERSNFGAHDVPDALLQPEP